MAKKKKVQDALFARLKRDLAAGSAEEAERKASLLRSRLFQQQLDFLNDPSRKKTLLCPRRAGKTYALTTLLVTTCLTRPRANCVYITMTRGTAQSLIWEELKHLDTELELGINFHNTNLVATFPRGGSIKLTGAETAHDVDKLRGKPYDVVVLDESKSFPPDIIDELVKQVIEPALHDRAGTLIMAGTPGAILAGVFYEATREGSAITRPWRSREGWERPFTWSGHSWNTSDNQAMPHIWQGFLADKEANRWHDDDPIWRREYLGQWVADDSGFVFRYNDERNSWLPELSEGNPFGLPDGHEWRFVLGVDLGFNDDTDIEVAAYSETCDTMYHVYSFAQPGLVVSEIARELRKAEQIFGQFDAMIGDRGGLGRTIIESLNAEYGFDIQPAEKQEKRDHIELCNSDLMAGRIKVLRGSHLERQMKYAQWDERGKDIDKGFPDHAIDAFVYLWRHCFHHYTRQVVEAPKRGTEAYYAWAEAQEEARLAEQYERNAETDWWERDNLEEVWNDD